MSDNTRPRGLGGLWDRLRTRFFYRVSVTGTTRLPSLGGGLIVSNHVSPVDPELIWRALHSTGGRELADRLEFLPVEREADGEPNTDPDLIARAREKLKAGGLVCLFAEGRVPRSGKLLRFTHAMEELVRDLNVPIIPLAIDRPWGSLVQIRGGKARWKWPRRFPYPVNMRFGESLAPSSSAFRVRLAVQEQQASLLASRIYPSETLPNKFIRAARRFPFRLAMVDHSGKELSFLKALAGTIALRGRLKKRLEEDQRVGVLLPPTVGGALVNAALGMLGKVAVNLNYTASPEIYRYCVEKAKLKRVLTSKKFLEKIGWEASEEMLFLEDVLPEVTIFRRIGALLAASLLPTRALCRLYSKPTDPNAPVAVLFSSGSTGNPKGVVLSHFNILSNVQGMAQLLDFQPTDRIMGVLPFFHAFGYAVTLWFPLAAGYGAIYFPNPRDGRQVAKLIHKHRGTVIVCPPTFFQMYLRQCDPEQLRSLRYAIAGAEKLKAVLARQFEERFGLPLLEGYGATELSPAVSLNTFDSRDGDDVEVGRKSGSIGHPLPGVAVKAVHLDTGEDLDAGEEGMLLVKGPNVMLGYLDDVEATREVIDHGWYRTGDVGRIDEDGFIEITDRLSRFSKLGGEMVPHVKVESELQETASDARFAVTAVPDERKGERLVVLHTELPEGVTPTTLCDSLRERGLPNLFVPRPDSFVELEEIPLLASGKLDLRAVREIAAERVG